MSAALTTSSLSSFQSAGSETAHRRPVLARLAEALWTNGPLLDSFKRGGRGWESGVARHLGVSREDLTAFVSGIGGAKRVRDIVFANPAGPVRFAIERTKVPVHMAESYGCPTSGCATSGCATSGCGTAHCGTYACGELKPSKNRKPDVT